MTLYVIKIIQIFLKQEYVAQDQIFHEKGTFY